MLLTLQATLTGQSAGKQPLATVDGVAVAQDDVDKLVGAVLWPLEDRLADYLARGVRLVWVVDPKAKTVTVHRGHWPAMTLGVDDVIVAPGVVHGFTCRVARFFE